MQKQLTMSRFTKRPLSLFNLDNVCQSECKEMQQLSISHQMCYRWIWKRLSWEQASSTCKQSTTTLPQAYSFDDFYAKFSGNNHLKLS